MGKYAIGVDIGGTKIALGMVDKAGAIIAREILPTDVTIPAKAMIDKVSEAIKALMKAAKVPEADIIGIGIGAPGPLDTEKGLIISPPNLPTWAGEPIVAHFKAHFNMPIVLENDANAATLAEKWLGAGRDCDDFVFMTISTGIGAGIYAGGELVKGKVGNAGDIGHIVVNPAFGKCTCGQYGCIESIASGTAIAKRASALRNQELDAAEVFALYHAGDTEIIELIDSILKEIGVACVTIVNMLEPEAIVLGGGVTKVGDLLFDTVRDYVHSYALSPSGRKTRIVQAELNQDAGLIGAAKLCL